MCVYGNKLKNSFKYYDKFNVNSFFKDFIYVFLERGREGEREGEKHQRMVASRAPPTGDLALNPGICPDWEWSPLVHRLALNTLSHISQG